MKKIFLTVCTLALAVGLVGCGSNESSQGGSTATQVEGKADDESVAKARELMENFFETQGEDNVTEVQTVKTIKQIDGKDYSNVKSTFIAKDLTGDEPRYMVEVESDPEDETDFVQYINGHDAVIEQGDAKQALELTDETYESILDLSPNQNARVYYDCAESIKYHESDGLQVVQIQVDPAKLMESDIVKSGQFADFSKIDSCVAEYTFDGDGRISTFLNTITGTVLNNEGQEEQITTETKTLYTEYGTTEVPDLPEVTAEDAAAAENTEE